MNRNDLSVALLGCALFLLPGCGQDSGSAREADSQEKAGENESEFLRFVEDADRSSRLETAITRYVDADGRIVDLVGAVHVGDPDYYEQLNLLFKSYDAILYEAVAPKDKKPMPGGDSSVSSVQRMMKDLLDLDFQLDAVDYSPENFVHADLEPDEFFALMDERGESLFTLMLQVMLAEMKRTGDNPEEAQAQSMAMLLALFAKDRARALKVVLGRQFGELEKMAAGLETGLDGEGSVLVVERNKAAFRAMVERIEAGDKKMAIFYGAAHLPDMERRLLNEYGFSRKSEDWITAWDIEPPQKERDPED